MKSFKTIYTLEKRKSKCNDILNKRPGIIPVIAEHSNFQDNKTLKFLVESELTVGQFIHILRKKIEIKPEEALFIQVNNKIPNMVCLLKELYLTEKDTDGFLYMYYKKENTFG